MANYIDPTEAEQLIIRHIAEGELTDADYDHLLSMDGDAQHERRLALRADAILAGAWDWNGVSQAFRRKWAHLRPEGDES